MVVLKARQWGGSTLTQLYIAWLQLLHKKGLNSLIVLLLKDTSIVPRFVETTLDWDFWVAKIIATAVVMVWNFVANNFFTFRQKRH